MTRLDKAKLALLLEALARTKGNKTHAAKWIGISIRTFRNWEIQYKIRAKGLSH